MKLQVGDEEHDIFSMARYVGIPGEKIDRFMRVAEMCGYELKKKDVTDAAGDRQTQESK